MVTQFVRVQANLSLFRVMLETVAFVMLSPVPMTLNVEMEFVAMANVQLLVETKMTVPMENIARTIGA